MHLKTGESLLISPEQRGLGPWPRAKDNLQSGWLIEWLGSNFPATLSYKIKRPLFLQMHVAPADYQFQSTNPRLVDQTLGSMKKPAWKLVTEYPVATYACGLRAGERLELKKDIVLNQSSKPTGQRLKKGGVWQVLAGSKEKPVVVWLRQPDGKTHTWDDDLSTFDSFSRLSPEPNNPRSHPVGLRPRWLIETLGER